MALMEKIKIGISTCLLGENVRYDGGHQHDRYLTDTLGNYFEYTPVCPEVEYGLPIPREAMRLVGTPETARLVTIKTGIDHTDGMLKWSEVKLKELEKENLCGFIFKANSPSSGMQAVKVYGPSGMPVRKGVGIFAGSFRKRFPILPVEEDGRLHDPLLRENFIERVFVYKRWQDMLKEGRSIKNIVDFHTRHKLLVMSHSTKHTNELGKLVADAKNYRGDVFEEYIKTLMEALCLLATVKKQTNVLQHILGYFKKHLSGDEKQEMLEVIENYHRQLLPLIVPITLIAHYVKKHREPYLEGQYYLHPHPMELMLRNHV
jgi:uncharacterized protein YbgA (DUF1722 family)/uncharacterized protein YbbK (DUF523 family)